MKTKGTKTACFLLALVLVISLLPGSVLAEAAGSSWTHIGDAIAEGSMVAYSGTSHRAEADWSARMQYTGIEDATGKDWTVEFDLEDAEGALGVYLYDASGAMYSAYLDTDRGVLDSVRFDDWETCSDGFYLFEGKAAEAKLSNWTAADKVKSHIRVDFIRGGGSSMAGGTVKFYKKNLTTGQYVELGKLSVSSRLKDSAKDANLFGLHLILGKATVSNLSVTELTASLPLGVELWDHASTTEKWRGKAVYNKNTGTMTLSSTTAGMPEWSSWATEMFPARPLPWSLTPSGRSAVLWV